MNNEITYDVIIIGSGVAGALPAAKLAKKGLKVLILEAGHRITRAETVANFRTSTDIHPSAAYPQYPGAQYPTLPNQNNYVVETGKDRINPLYLKAVGGTTWHWAATTPRFIPNEFELKTKHGLAVDWPINYKDLEPYYSEAEREMGVSGDNSADLLSWRSNTYPLDKHRPSWMEQKLQEKLQPHGIDLEIRPLARNTEFFDGRPTCTGNHNCTPICPTGAQYAAINHIEKAEQNSAEVIDQCTVSRLNIAKNGLVESVGCKKPDGSSLVFKAKSFILAANAIESPRLLLLSRTESHQQGVANSSGTVGKYLTNHHIMGIDYTLSDKVYSGRGHFGCLIINQFRDNKDKSVNPGMLFLTSNKVDSQAVLKKSLSKKLYGSTLIEDMRDEFSRRCTLSCFMEELPYHSNSLQLHPTLKDDLGLPRPLINYKKSDYLKRGIKLAEQRFSQIGHYLNAVSSEQHSDQYRGSAHVSSTTRMGNDPSQSVVDSECRSHDHANLYISSGSVFPTIGTANSTLTIAALSLRIADSLFANFKSLG